MKRTISLLLVLTLVLTGIIVVPFTSAVAEEEMISVEIPNYNFEQEVPGVDFSKVETALFYRQSDMKIPGWKVANDFTYYDYSTGDGVTIQDGLVDSSGKPWTIARTLFYGIGKLAYLTCKPVDKAEIKASPTGDKMLIINDQDENGKPKDKEGNVLSKADRIMIYNEDIIPAAAGIEYTMAYDLMSDWNMGDDILFYNDLGQVWNHNKKTWVEATFANEKDAGYSCSKIADKVNEDGVKLTTNKWNKRVLKRVAPTGTTGLRTAFYSGAGSGNMCVDNVKVTFSTKKALPVPNSEFTKRKSIPGWTPYFYIADFLDNEYYCLADNQKMSGNYSLKLRKDGPTNGVFVYSDPILVPTEGRDQKYFKLQVDAMTDIPSGEPRGRYVLQFYRNGEDGIPGTPDDLVYNGRDLASATYNKETGVMSGGKWGTVSESFNLSGTDSFRVAEKELTKEWTTYEHIVKLNEDYDYVRVSFYQFPKVGNTSAYYDNVRVGFGNDNFGFSQLTVKNPGFEEQMEIDNWTQYTPEATSSNLSYILTDSQKFNKNLTMKITGKQTDSILGIWSDSVDVQSGLEYELSFQYYSADNLFYDVKFFNTEGKLYDPTTLKYIDASDENLINSGLKKSVAEQTDKILTKKEKFVAPPNASTARICFGNLPNETTTSHYGTISLSVLDGLSCSSPVLMKDGVTVTEALMLSKGDTIKAQVSLYNNTDETKKVRIMLAKYTNGNLLEKVVSKKIILNKRLPNTTVNNLITDGPEMVVPSDGGSYKIFVWDDILNMSDIVNPIEIPNHR